MLARWVIFVLFVSALGCGGGGGAKKPGATVDVKGTVMLDGKHLPEGKITFLFPGEPPAEMDVKGGAYAGKAAPGKNRVEVRAFKAAPKSPTALSTDDPSPKVNYLPDRYNAASTLEADVKADGANDFTFKVTSR